MLLDLIDYSASITSQQFDFWYILVSDASPNSHQAALGSEKQTLISQIGITNVQKLLENDL